MYRIHLCNQFWLFWAGRYSFGSKQSNLRPIYKNCADINGGNGRSKNLELILEAESNSQHWSIHLRSEQPLLHAIES
jgi:hypothetical protein